MEYSVIRSNRRSIAVEIQNCRAVVRAPLCYSDGQIENFVMRNEKWITTHLAKAEENRKKAAERFDMPASEIRAVLNTAKTVFSDRVAYYAPLVGVTYSRVSVRFMRSRWGSCSSKGALGFNSLLVLAPPEVLDSVVVHELCHRKQMNHSDKFYSEVLRVFPDYNKCREWLDENSEILHAAGERACE